MTPFCEQHRVPTGLISRFAWFDPTARNHNTPSRFRVSWRGVSDLLPEQSCSAQSIAPLLFRTER